MAKKPRRGRVFWVARDSGGSVGISAWWFATKPVMRNGMWGSGDITYPANFMTMGMGLEPGECVKVRVVEEGR